MRKLGKKKDSVIAGKFAHTYNEDTKNARLDEMRGYATMVKEQLPNGGIVLEIAPGPGFLSIELAKLGKYKITGVELSAELVAISKENAKAENVEVEFLQGSANELPLKDGIFDFVICTAAFKNFKEPLKAMQEMYRVLKVGGTALIIDMDKDTTNAELNIMVKSMKKKGLTALFYKIIFKWLRKTAYSSTEIDFLIKQTNFANSKIDKKDGLLEIWMYKKQG